MGTIKQIGKNVVIDIFKLESGNKIICAYVDPKNIEDISFKNLLKRVAFA